MKNKGLLIGIAVVVLLAIMVFGSYNSLVTMEETVDAKWANVDSVLQRRYDLIPNLVESVKGSMQQEEKIFTAIADARTKMAGANTVDDKVAASSELEGALGRLLVVMENYPELKSSDNVTALMDELAGTENRISTERTRFNDAVRDYNSSIRKFPKNILAGMFGFDAKVYFEAVDGAETAPEVKF